MKAFIRPKTLLCLAAVGTVTTAVLLAEPSWWVTRGSRNPALPASDYAALNQGQLKNLARAARDEMEAKFPGGAGAAINTLVNSWSAAAQGTSDYSAASVGQLKALAELFYERYEQLGIQVSRPWSPGTAGDADFAAANLGQAKNAFSFQILGDTDNDGLLDQLEWQLGTNVNNPDTDGDGVFDGREIQEGTDALSNASSSRYLLNLRVYTPLEKAS